MAAGIYPYGSPGCYSPGSARRDVFPTSAFQPTHPSELPAPEVWQGELRAQGNVNSITTEHAKLVEKLVNKRILNSDQHLIMRVCDAFFHFYRWRTVLNPIEAAFQPFYLVGIPETFKNTYMTIITANLLYDYQVAGMEQYEDLAWQIDKVAKLNSENEMSREEAFELFKNNQMDGAAACTLVIKDCIIKKRIYEAFHFVSSLKKNNLHIGAANQLAFYLAQEHTWKIDTITEFTAQKLKDFLVDFQNQRSCRYQLPSPEDWEQELRAEGHLKITPIRFEYVKLLERLVWRERLDKNECLILRVYNAFFQFFRWRTKLDPVMVAFDPFHFTVIPETFQYFYTNIITANLLYANSIQEIEQYENLARQIDRVSNLNYSIELKRENACELFNTNQMEGALACSLVIRDCLAKKRVWEAIHFVSSLTKVNLKIGAANFLAIFLTQDYTWEKDQLNEIKDKTVRDHLSYYQCKKFSGLKDIERLKEYSHETIR